MRSRTEAASVAENGAPLGIGFIELLPLIMDMVTKFLPILASCKQKPPPTPPVPPALSAVGVTQDTFHKAFVSKYAAEQSVKDDGSFYPIAIRRAKVEIAKSKGIKKKAALPLAIAALESGRDETLEDIAIGLQSVVSNASALGS